MAESRRPAKKALCVGIEYIELSSLYPQLRLRGTYQDTVTFAQLLQNVYGYQAQDIRILTDNAANSTCQPTRENIISAMNDLVKDARAGDHLLFLYAGHGSQVEALPEHYEEDGFDEVIWPADVKYTPTTDDKNDVENYIVDDDLRHCLVDSLPPGVHLVIVFDCCNSGTGADLEFSCGTSPLPSPVESRKLNVSARPEQSRGIVSLPHKAQGFVDRDANVDIFHKHPQTKQNHSSPDSLPYVTSWSACPDDQSTLENKYGGVFVQAFTAALKEDPSPTHGQFLKALTRWLYNNIKRDVLESPKPQLGSIRDIASIRDTLFEI